MHVSKWYVRRALAHASTIMVATSTLAAQAPVPARRADNQLRPEFSVTLPALPRVDVVLGGQAQFGQYAAGLVQDRIGVSVQWKATRFLTLTPGYQRLNQHSQAGATSVEHRPSATGTLRLALTERVTVADRNLVEFRFRDGGRTTRYRNRVTIERAVGGASADARVYLSDEVFYDSRYRAWVRNQLAVGAGRALTRHLSADVYLMRQNDGYARPGDLLVVGTVLRARL